MSVSHPGGDGEQTAGDVCMYACECLSPLSPKHGGQPGTTRHYAGLNDQLTTRLKPVIEALKISG